MPLKEKLAPHSHPRNTGPWEESPVLARRQNGIRKRLGPLALLGFLWKRQGMKGKQVGIIQFESPVGFGAEALSPVGTWPWGDLGEGEYCLGVWEFEKSVVQSMGCGSQGRRKQLWPSVWPSNYWLPNRQIQTFRKHRAGTHKYHCRQFHTCDHYPQKLTNPLFFMEKWKL